MKKSYRAITTAYSILHDIESDKDLKKYNFSLSDYYNALATMEELRKPGSATETFLHNVAEFFKNCGFYVNNTSAGNYKIFTDK